ncbi:MAG: OmpA family protein [Saprospiraceae bacterium]
MSFFRLVLLSSVFTFFCTCSYGQESYLIEKLGSQINSTYDEITPIVDWDGKVLYFTRSGYPDFNKTLVVDDLDQSQVLSTMEYRTLLNDIFGKISNTTIAEPESSGYNQDIWIANSDKSEFDKIVHPPAPLNNALPNSISTMMPQLRTFMVINQFIPEGGMDIGFSVVRQMDDSTWTFPQAMHIDDFYTNQAGTSIAMSSDGKVMILGLSRNDALGDLDLYFSIRKEDSTWSAPRNMGIGLNTKWRESTPFLSLDMKRLYFSSNRTGSLGGMDLFYADRLDDSWYSWSEIRHFVSPINSSADESQPFFNYATGYLYFTSKREGSSDIFRVKTAPAMPQIASVVGKIVNTSDNTNMDADVIFNVKNSEALLLNYSQDGHFSFSIPKGDTIKVFAKKRGFISSIHYIKIEKFQHFPLGYPLQINMTPIVDGGKIALQNLYFKQSEPEILSESFDELNEIAQILTDHKDISIMIEGYTDNAGKADELMQLSEKRAEAVKSFLAQKKINPARISIKAFGGTRPVYENPKNEDERRANRRVEIRIIKK